MIKEINGRWWYCCPLCGKKLLPLQYGAECHGVLTQCRERRMDGIRCGWKGEIIVEAEDWNRDRPA